LGSWQAEFPGTHAGIEFLLEAVHVYDEFGELKEVVIGSPLAEDDCIFEWIPGMDEEFAWMKPDTFKFLKENAGKPWSKANPELFAKVNWQVDNYAETMEKHGVKVHRLPRLVHGDRKYIDRNKGDAVLFRRFGKAGNTGRLCPAVGRDARRWFRDSPTATIGRQVAIGQRGEKQ